MPEAQDTLDADDRCALFLDDENEDHGTQTDVNNMKPSHAHGTLKGIARQGGIQSYLCWKPYYRYPKLFTTVSEESVMLISVQICQR